jgi:hypothetical protein
MTTLGAIETGGSIGGGLADCQSVGLGSHEPLGDVEKDFLLNPFPCSTESGHSNNEFNASGPFWDAPEALISASQGPRRPQLRTA